MMWSAMRGRLIPIKTRTRLRHPTARVQPWGNARAGRQSVTNQLFACSAGVSRAISCATPRDTGTLTSHTLFSGGFAMQRTLLALALLATASVSTASASYAQMAPKPGYAPQPRLFSDQADQ
jgi:hypothetical protein